MENFKIFAIRALFKFFFFISKSKNHTPKNTEFENFFYRFENSPIPIPVFFEPYFLSSKKEQLMSQSAELLLKSLRRVGSYLSKNLTEDYFPISSQEKQLLLRTDWQKDIVFPFARLDGSFQNGIFKIYDVNADSPAGPGFIDPLYREYFSLPINKIFQKLIGVTHNPQFNYKFYQVLSDFFGSRLNFLHIVLDKNNQKSDFFVLNEIRNYLKEHRVDADFYSLEEFKNILQFHKEKIICALSWNNKKNAFNHIDQINKLAGPLKILNLGVNLVLSNKKFFAFFYHPIAKKIFTESELKNIRQIIPPTFLLKETYKINPNLFQRFYEKKNNYVIKPIDGFDGNGVLIGKYLSEDMWREWLMEKKDGESYLIQEFIKLEERQIVKQTLYIDFLPYLYNEKYFRSWARISKKPITNISKGGMLLPLIVLN